jgi:predicted ATPase/class 3 adenylate cyclase
MSPVPGRHPLASFVPLLLEQRLRDGWSPQPWGERRRGAVLAADISGSTALTADFAARPGGIERLSTVLDAAFGTVVDAVTVRGGDVLGFVGDGLIAFWPDDDGGGAVASAVAAGVQARDALARSPHPVRMRIAIAGGPVDLWNLGGERDEWMFVPSGMAVSEAMALQAASVVGEVAVSSGVAARLDSGSVLQKRAVVPRGTPSTGEERRLAAPMLASVGDEFVDLVRPYLPATVVARLVAGHREYVSELRTVTALFARVPELTTQAKLEWLQDLMASFQRVVHRYASVVNRMSVDDKGAAVLVVFGLPPHVHEDDPDRALAAAQQLHGEMTARGMGHGIGIATGPCFCGVVGNDDRRHYTVLGDVVNVAARLAGSALADPGLDVLADRATTVQVAHRWRFATPIFLRLKGKAEPLDAYSPLRRTPRDGALLADTPMVGRDDELRRIERALDASTLAPGRLVLVAGEPGIGKSRLLAEAHHLALAGGRLVASGSGDSLDQSVPYHAWRPVLRALLGIDSLEPDAAARHLGDRLGERAALVAPIVGVETADSPPTTGLSGESRIQATRQLLAELVRTTIAERGKLALLFEDVHWLDSASWGLLGATVPLEGLVVVCTARPWSAPAPRDVEQLLASPATEIVELGSMTPGEVGELARLRLDAEDVTPDLAGLLHERCAGNPFFVVEVVTSLQRSGVLTSRAGAVTLVERKEVPVPPTVHVAITSRVDQLGAEEQLTLKVASVVGDPFGVSTIAAIHPTRRGEDALVRDLEVLVATEFAVPGPESDAYALRHALIRDSAYQLMLANQRQALHRQLAEHYETSGSRAPAAVLAHHWRHGEDDDKAVRYLGLAAVDALAHGMPREAVDHGVTAARILGIELATDPAEIAALLPAKLREVDRLMAGRSPRELADLPPLGDERVATAIALVLQAMPSAHQSLQTELFALMAVRNLELTLRHGAGPLASGVYAMYSILMRGLDLPSREAFEFSQLAREVDAANGHVLPAAVGFIHVWFNNHWYEPMSTSIPIALQGGEAGLSGPDLLYGSFNLAAATTLLATSGGTLDQVVEMGERHLERVRSHSATAAFHSRLEAQMAKALAGRTPCLTSLTDEWCQERELAAMAETDNFNQTAYYYVAKARLSYLDGDAGTASAYAQRAYELLPSFAGQVGEVELTVFSALARLATLPPDGPDRAEALDEARARLAQLEAWSEGCAANFQHKALLVAAELAEVEGHPDSAGRLFSAATAAALRHGFVQFAALATERWGRSLLGRDPQGARERLADAAAHYRAWGALLKARNCEAAREEGSASGATGPRSTTLHDTSGPSATSATNGGSRSS